MSKGANLVQVQSGLDATDIKFLNAQNPGMGQRISAVLTHLGNVLAASGGHSGTVVFKKQKNKDAAGLVDASASAEGGRFEDVADPIRDLDAVNFRTLRRWCLKNEQDAEDPKEPPFVKPVCLPTQITDVTSKATELVNIYAVQVMNEFIYVMGDNGSIGKFQVWHHTSPNNAMVLVGQLNTTQLFTRMILIGEYILGTGPGTDLTIIDIRKPNAPVELTITAVGGNGIHGQGRYAFVPAAGGIRIVDISNVELPIAVGTAV